MEDEPEIDPQKIAMEKVISLLTPLREHRRGSAERAQRRIQIQLQAMQKQLLQTADSLNQEQAQQRFRRIELADANLLQTLELSDVDRWHEQERRMLDRLAYIRQDIQRQSLRVNEQEQLLEQAMLTTKAQQRKVEKLACLTQALNEG